MFNFRLFDNFVLKLTSLGNTSDFAGINNTSSMVYLALDIAITKNMKPQRKERIIRKKELKKKLREDLPKELAEILCNLI